jgi:hypothetical protein
MVHAPRYNSRKGMIILELKEIDGYNIREKRNHGLNGTVASVRRWIQ